MFFGNNNFKEIFNLFLAFGKKFNSEIIKDKFIRYVLIFGSIAAHKAKEVSNYLK